MVLGKGEGFDVYGLQGRDLILILFFEHNFDLIDLILHDRQVIFRLN